MQTQWRQPEFDLECGDYERLINSIHTGSLAVLYCLAFVDSMNTSVFSRKENIDQNKHSGNYFPLYISYFFILYWTRKLFF